MATFKVEIETDNAAFDDCGMDSELSSILKRLAKRIDERGISFGEEIRIRDGNGNTVGTAELTED